MTPAADGSLIYVCGSTRSGKTAYVQRETRRAKSLLVWDVEAQYARCIRIDTMTGLVSLLRRPHGRAAYSPDRLSRFDFWARAAWAWCRSTPGRVIVAEELADVTTPGKAPDAWGILIRRALKYATTIYAITQRPAESDKTALGNATQVVVFRLSSIADRRYVAARLGVDAAELPTQPLDYLIYDALSGRRTRQKLTFPPARRRNVARRIAGAKT